MRVFFARLLFAIAAGSAALASVGVAAPPHRVPDGTPLFHTLVIGAYRFAFLIEPAPQPGTMTPQMAALHKALALAGIPMTDMPGMDSATSTATGPVFSPGGLNPTQELAIVFALLVLCFPRLPRPMRRVVARLCVPPIAIAQWREAVLCTPPRAIVLRVS